MAPSERQTSLPKALFHRLVKSALDEQNSQARIGGEALDLLQDLTEADAVRRLSDARLVAEASGRGTVYVADMQTAAQIRRA